MERNGTEGGGVVEMEPVTGAFQDQTMIVRLEEKLNCCLVTISGHLQRAVRDEPGPRRHGGGLRQRERQVLLDREELVEH